MGRVGEEDRGAWSACTTGWEIQEMSNMILIVVSFQQLRVTSLQLLQNMTPGIYGT